MGWDQAMLEGARRALRQRWESEEATRRERVDALRAEAERCAALLAADFGARRVVLFGSVAAGHGGMRSDLDLAVEGVESRRYFEVLGRLGMETWAPIDLVLLEEAPPSLVERIQREGVVLHG